MPLAWRIPHGAFMRTGVLTDLFARLCAHSSVVAVLLLLTLQRESEEYVERTLLACYLPAELIAFLEIYCHLPAN